MRIAMRACGFAVTAVIMMAGAGLSTANAAQMPESQAAKAPAAFSGVAGIEPAAASVSEPSFKVAQQHKKPGGNVGGNKPSGGGGRRGGGGNGGRNAAIATGVAAAIILGGAAAANAGSGRGPSYCRRLEHRCEDGSRSACRELRNEC